MNPYASFLGDRDPMEVVAQSPSLYRQLVGRLGESGLKRSLAPGKWSVNVILCHLADAEIGFSFRLRQTLAEDDHTTQPWDQDKWSKPYPKLNGNDALEAYAASRAWNVAWLRTLPPEAFTRPFTHPERGRMTMQSLVETMAGHDLNHLQQLEAIAIQVDEP